MCGRIGHPELTWRQFLLWQEGKLDWDEVYRDQQATDLKYSWNVKPTQSVEIAYADGNALVSNTARWWFVPHWHKGDVRAWKQTTFNARIETADQKPTFRTAWASGRCVVPVSGYYEWTGDKGHKQPWWITVETNAPAMYLAGLFSRPANGPVTAAILTRDALPQIKHIHARTPVILTYDQLWPWVTGAIGTNEAKSALGTGWDGRMKFHEVAPFKRDDDGPHLIEPIHRLF